MNILLSLAAIAVVIAVHTKALALEGVDFPETPTSPSSSSSPSDATTGKPSDISTALTPDAPTLAGSAASIVQTTPASPAQTSGVTAPATAPVPETAPSPIHTITVTLKDGSKAQIADDGSVTIQNADGTTSTAPDGILTLRNDTTFDVKDGKKVDY